MTDTAPSTEPAALFEKRGHIGIITLNRPRAMNAVNSALSVAAGDALARAQEDPDVRVVVITGAGRGFCAGADLKELARGNRIDDRDHPERGFAGLVRQFVGTPTIAAVNGYAMGGGTEIVLACDLAVIDETASLGLPEVKRGLFAAAGGVLRLQRQIPQKIALETILTGEPMSAARAYELGLVNRVAPEGTALEVALQVAEVIAANAPVSVQQSKRVVHETWSTDWGPEAWAVNTDAMKVVFASRDSREGPRAFAEKRDPVWEGR
ncbi:crotonase/enoyl-CoA hydratase family protein [Pseudonocardia sp. WMMC193]|uniref:crotonase/enoyl-CoA hydratase family protein n=1 Tax=Pseudonocardia sp. WMMC193 TaxID=2911965 RepID=UPI001F028D8D|nr:crotonase/enoyl-CoA hydratase family protein [Pseudonocardia sp. WMMC193]MCF7549534.1 crotonase/enoyl-CoA hydratase family protein [Pseudonocardia sp. WMMC193]